MGGMLADLWPTTESLIRANHEAAHRARAEGDLRRALTHETAAKLLEMGQR
jgi:hypothetical protein